MNENYQSHLNAILEDSFAEAVRKISSNMGVKDNEELLKQIDYIVGESPKILSGLLLDEFRNYGWGI